MKSYHYIMAFFVPFLSVLFMVPLIKRNALRFGFVDMPAARKVHISPVPLGGGLAVFLGVLLSAVFALFLMNFRASGAIIGLFAGAFLLTTVGFLDDIFDLDYVTKLLGQFVSAMIFLSFLDQTILVYSMPVDVIISVLWIVSLSNALNFLDNMDGLCGGIALISSLAFGILFLLKGMPIYAIYSFSIAGASLAFIRYNFSHASIFLGDAGSLFFGYSLSCLAIVHFHTNSSMSVAGALSPVIILAYPLFDLIFVTFSRLKEGRKLYIGGKDHSSHKLNIIGLNKRKTVFIILMMNILLATLGMILYRFEDSPVITLIIVVSAVVLSFFGAHLYKNFIFLKEKLSLGLADLISINIAFILYFLVKAACAGSNIINMSINDLIIALAWINAFWLILYAVVGLYDLYFEAQFKKQFILLFKTLAIGFIIFLIANYDSQQGFEISFLFIGLFLLILMLVNLLFRWLLYVIIRKRCFCGDSKLKAVMVCLKEEKTGHADISEISKNYNIIGCIGKRNYKDLKYLGEIHNLHDILHKNKVARVIVDYSDDNYTDITEIFASAYYMETAFLMPSGSGENIKGLRIKKTTFDDVFIVSLKHRGLFPMLIKRLADFILAGTTLILASPYFIIKLFGAKRESISVMGEAQILTFGEKIGSIKINPGKNGKGDLRSLWALISILRGNICIYGTTITSVADYKANMNSIKGYWRKFLVKPGLFGPGYSGKTAIERFNLDLAYMEKTSTFGDFRMILKQLFGMSAVKLEELKNA